MRRFVWSAVAAAAVCAGAPAAFADCAKDTQMEINDCTRAAAASAQKRMDKAFDRAVKRTDGPAKAELVSSQKTWVRTRDAACDARAAEYEGGSMQPSVYYGCMEEMTNGRAGTLKQAGR